MCHISIPLHPSDLDASRAQRSSHRMRSMDEHTSEDRCPVDVMWRKPCLFYGNGLPFGIGPLFSFEWRWSKPSCNAIVSLIFPHTFHRVSSNRASFQPIKLSFQKCIVHILGWLVCETSSNVVKRKQKHAVAKQRVEEWLKLKGGSPSTGEENLRFCLGCPFRRCDGSFV